MQTDPFIGRKVAFIFGPLALAIATVLSAKSQAWFGIQVNTAEAAAFILSIAAGIITWLYNRGKHEVAELTGLSEATLDQLAQRIIERNPPGRPGVAPQPITLAWSSAAEPPPSGQESLGGTTEPPPPSPGGTSAGQ